MKKLSLVGLLVVLMVTPMFAAACPKGTHPVGGTGSHHKGGTCLVAEGGRNRVLKLVNNALAATSDGKTP